jgi:hypothetical protein
MPGGAFQMIINIQCRSTAVVLCRSVWVGAEVNSFTSATGIADGLTMYRLFSYVPDFVSFFLLTAGVFLWHASVDFMLDGDLFEQGTAYRSLPDEKINDLPPPSWTESEIVCFPLSDNFF